MTEEKRGIRKSFVLSMAGAMIAYYIGASTGTGQEFFQSYGTHGFMGIIGVIIQQVVIAALATMVIFVCRKYNLTNSKSFFTWFLGKFVGTIVYYYTAAFVFATLVQLISGTGAIVNQFYNVPSYLGSVGLSILLMVSILLGFERLIDVISKIAPFIVIVMVLVAIVSLINPTDGIREGSQLILANQEVYRTSATWWGSTVLHHSYLILFFIPYFVNCYTVDTTATKRETISWIVIAYSILAVLTGLMIVSQVANISLAIGSQAPNVSIATVHTPVLAIALVAMIVAASYTTTAPIALIAADYFAEPGTSKHKITGIIIVLIGLGVSFLGSYAQIINVLIAVSGRIGLAVYIFAVIYRIYVKTKYTNKKGEIINTN